MSIDTSAWTHETVREFYDFLSEWDHEWQGLPVSLGDDMPLKLTPGHRLAPFIDQIQAERSAAVDDGGEVPVVNWWWSRARQANVYIVDVDGRREAAVVPVSPDRSMDRLKFWMRTIGACDAWHLDAEMAARDTLRAMLTERQWRHYEFTGSFIETSARSGLTYVFRRLRPTIALSPRWPWFRRQQDSMRCLAVLCLHPIGYYEQTWAGCMVPSGDVMAHLAMMRGDEAYFWRCANQHQLDSPEAGL
jgi:hypothetical protein